MNRELLEKPFTPEQIKQREGSFGKVLEYVEGHAVIQRLNDAFESQWSFEIIEHEILNDEVIVLGKLTAVNVVKTQFGSSLITKARETGETISLADDLKSAATDALKKTATLLGVGLHLYNGGSSLHNHQNQYNTDNTYSEGSYDNPGGNGVNGTNGNGQITVKQLRYLSDLGRNLNMDSKGLDNECLKAFGVKMAYLSVKDASSFIDVLKSKAM
ncbi:Rad52/Rad22 family DNA repair protein [Thermodesulfobacteriota bacterium]